MIKLGTFREDLFYRLNVIPIFLPQLADRRDDLDSLINIFVKKFNRLHSKKISGLSSDAMGCLKKYSWPGNIRELENVIEHAFILESSNVLTMPSLPEYVLSAVGVNLLDMPLEDLSSPIQLNRAATPAAAAHSANDLDDSDEASMDDALSDEDGEIDASIEISAGGDLDFNAQKEAFEKEFIIKALKTFKGRINQTALHANIPKKTLLRKIEKYGINPKEYLI